MKKYTHNNKFVDYYEYEEKDGTKTRFNFKSSFDTFLIFKDITGECLTVGLDRFQKQQLKVLENFNGNIDFFTLDEQDKKRILEDSSRKEQILEGIKKGYEQAIEPHVYECGLEFSDAVILSMFAAGLNENDRTEALGLGIECLPEEIYTDITFFTKLITNLMKTKKDLKKKGLLPKL